MRWLYTLTTASGWHSEWFAPGPPLPRMVALMADAVTRGIFRQFGAQEVAA